MKAPRTFLGGFLAASLGLALHAAPALAETPASSPISDAADPAAAPLAAPAPKPAGYDLPSPGTRWELLLTGVAVTGVSYGLALGSSYAWPDARYSNELKIPIAGPWMAIADTGCPKD